VPQEILTAEIAAERLAAFVSPDYRWPAMLPGWQLEFIAYPDGGILMDLLHPVSGVFWSDENGFLEQLAKSDGTPITVHELIAGGVPFMTTFGTAQVSDIPREPHLKVVP